MEDFMCWEEYIKFTNSKVVEKAVRFCENVECEDCPVAIEGLEHRTRHDKQDEHVPCVDNLIFELANGRTLD